MTDILVIGGGAAGMAAAISAKMENPRLEVVIAESKPRVGKKLLATGNGRCNLMNTLAQPEDYLGDAEFIRPALEAYRREYSEFWANLGLELREEEEGRVYPATNQAATVLDVLRLALSELGIEERTDTEIDVLRPGFYAGEIRARRVILATGGKAGKGLGENESFARLLQPLGHRITRVYPGLTPLKVEREQIAGLKGVRLKGSLILLDRNKLLTVEKGEILFGEDAVSGIAAMQLSLRAAKGMRVRIKPEGRPDLSGRRDRFPHRSAEELLTGALPKPIGRLLLKRAGIALSKPAGSLTDNELKRIIDWEIPIIGPGDFTAAQIMRGGADTGEFDPHTLESRRVKGLYACGELLDVAGPCGGYNLEWAWASGCLAGRRAAQSL